MVVEQALWGSHRRRVKVVAIGSAERAVGQLGTHLRAGLDGPAICVLDGDCQDSDVGRWLRSADIDDSQLCLRLPLGGLPPERWIVEALREEPYLSDLARHARLDGLEVLAVLSEMDSLPDPHAIPRQFATRCSVPLDNVPYILASCAGTHPALQDIRESVASQLQGGVQ